MLWAVSFDPSFSYGVPTVQPLSVELVTAPVRVDSGLVENTGVGPQVVYTTDIDIPGAPWIRLKFEDVLLSGAVGSGTESYLLLTSHEDGAYQYLNAEHVAQWRSTSAYFNGEAVTVELVAHPDTGPNRLTMSEVYVGQIYTGDRSICGPDDDRVLSTDARVGRLQPGGCTAWMIDDCHHCFLSAGHCFSPNGDENTIVEFNVPLSDTDGSLNHPPPEDQYSIDPFSLQKHYIDNAPPGDDWAYFGCFPNSNTGLSPGEAQGDWFSLTAPPAVGGQDIRVTGYGTVDPPITPTWEQVQKTHAGPYDAFSGTLVQYQTDTTEGNSGSPVIIDGTNQAIGIHTNGGCSAAGGANSGTGSNHSGLQAAIANPLGMCCCPEVGEYFCPYPVNHHGINYDPDNPPEGDWETYPDHAIRLSPGDWEDGTAYYSFTLPHPPDEFNEDPSNYEAYIRDESLRIGFEFKDMAAIPWIAGPDFHIWDFDSNSWHTLCLGCGTQDDLTWKYYTPSNSNRLLSDEGEVRLKVYAINWADTVVDDVLVVYEAADESIASLDIAGRDDCCEDGVSDGVDITIDADVGSPGDGLTVSVEATARLKWGDAEVDSATLNWTITDTDSEPQTLTLSACGYGQNGEYTVEVELQDDAGNVEDTAADTITLSPDCGGAPPPAVQTLSATGIGTTGATLRGEILDDGGEVCQIRFRIREAGGGWWYPSGWHGAYIAGEEFSEAVGGLSPGTTYEFKAGAQNSAGEGWGGIVSFTTVGSGDIVVAPDGSGDYPTIQAAINAASNGDTIWLTDGTFTGDGNRDIDYLGKAITVRSQSDNPEACIIDCQGSAEDPHRGFYFHNDEGPESVLRGVTVQNGYVTTGSPFYGQGGGIWCRDGASPSFEKCTLRTNTAEDEGGAAHLDDDCVITFVDCRFFNNESRGTGGALEMEGYSSDDPVTLTGCVFTDNSADSDGGAVSALGPLVVQQSSFLRNYAGHQVGGAICWFGSGEDNLITVAGCDFVDNLAPTGGGGALFLYGYLEQALISDCYFAGNSAESGGALFSNVFTSLGNCVFVDNANTDEYGTVFFSGSATHVVERCTIAQSKAPNEGSGLRASGCNVTVNNSIIAFGNSPAVSCEYDAVVNLTCSDVYGNTGGDYVGCIAGQLGADGNISLDPLFWDGEHGDVHLQPDSPCAPAQQPTCGLIGAWDVAPWADCNENGMNDTCDIDCASPGGQCDLPGCGQSFDCNLNGSPDECDVEWETSPDCNGNGVPDECDIDGGWSDDYDLNGVPDECEDCNSNGVSDDCDIDCAAGDCASDPLGCGDSEDCQPNGVPDECDIANGDSPDIDGGGIPDECERCLGHESFKLLASDGIAFHHLGGAVSMFEAVAVVGTHVDSDDEAAYVFRFDGQEWVEEQRLEPSVGVVNDEYGTAVDVHGDWAIVGAPGEDHLGQASGSVYVFHYDGEAWIEHQELLASDGETDDFFGDSVALGDGVLVAGAPHDDSSGATYVFRLNGDTWLQEQKLVLSDPGEYSDFGRSVSTDGDAILVGASVYGNPENGAAFVFRFDGGLWEQEAALAPLGEPIGDFGNSVALSGDRALVGAPSDDDGGFWAGAAYVFRRNGAVWSQEQKLTALDAGREDAFGWSVALDGAYAVLGAPDLNGSTNYGGAAYVYRFDDDLWREEAQLKALDPTPWDNFGMAVAISDGRVVVGEPYDDELGNCAGAGYIFGGLSDCNANTHLDICDIANDLSADCQPNGVPDECDVDPSDPDGDGYVSADVNGNDVPDECEYAAICREPEMLENTCYEGEDASCAVVRRVGVRLLRGAGIHDHGRRELAGMQPVRAGRPRASMTRPRSLYSTAGLA